MTQTNLARRAAAMLFALACVPCGAMAQSAASPAPAAATPAAAAPAVTPTPLAEDPKITKRAVAEFLAWQKGAVDKALYSPEMVDAVSDVVIDNVSPQLKALGDYRSIEFVRGGVVNGLNAYIYLVTCTNGKMGMKYIIDPNGKVAGLFFSPPKQ